MLSYIRLQCWLRFGTSLFLALFYIFTQTSIIIFIAHSIYIVGSVDGHNIVVKCVIFLDIAPWSILKFVAGSP